MDIDVAGILALAVFGSYFLAILLLFTLILRSLPDAPLNTRAVWIFSLLTLASLAHTWFYMIKFLFWSFHTHISSLPLISPSPSSSPLLPQIASWLTHTALFSQAWAAVSFGPFNWWWSEQLCLYTAGAWTLFLYTQARRYKIRRVWAYMLLGQLVAVSVASGLFYVAVVLARAREVGAEKKKGEKKEKDGKERVPLMVTLPILLSLLTIIISPYTSPSNGTFLPNLLLMHALLLVPLLSSPSPASSTPSTASTQNKYTKYTITTHTLTTTMTLIALILRIIAYKAAFASLPPLPSTSNSNIYMFSAEAWRVLHAHPAQASIGWDVVWTGVGVGVWVLVGMRPAPVSRKDSEGPTTRKTPTHEGPITHKKSNAPTARKTIGKTSPSTSTPTTSTSPSQEKEKEKEEEAQTLYRKTLRLALLLTPFLSVGVTAPVVFERGRVLDGLARVEGGEEEEN